MILTRIELDPTRRSTIMALANPNRFHGAVEESHNRSDERVLWRIDVLSGRQYLMVLSPSEINAAFLADQFGYPGEKPEQKKYDPLLERIEAGSTWQFRLTANPTFSSLKERRSPEDRGKVKSEITTALQMEWLIRKSQKNGFSVNPEQARVTATRWITFRKQSDKRKVSLLQVTFEGILTVTDPELFRKALTEGIGRGKAYGMGFMTVVCPRVKS